MSDEFNWVDSINESCTVNTEREVLKIIAKVALNCKATRNFSDLNADLLKLNLNNLPTLILIALLRNTFTIRDHISCWYNLKSQIESILADRKLNSVVLLRGL